MNGDREVSYTAVCEGEDEAVERNDIQGGGSVTRWDHRLVKGGSAKS